MTAIMPLSGSALFGQLFPAGALLRHEDLLWPQGAPFARKERPRASVQALAWPVVLLYSVKIPPIRLYDYGSKSFLC